MSIEVSTTDHFAISFRPAEGGIVGVTDHLLHGCGGGAIVEHHEGRCLCRPIEGGEAAEVPLPKSSFRLVLARVAAMCHESSPEYGTPYEGSGVVKTRGEPAGTFQVSFVNTPDEQMLEVRRAELPGG